MNYQALYRKYRSMTFSDVVGQEAITTTLSKQVASGQTTHAYLFTGTRGTGKTSCAKILARAVNCITPQNGEPCNVCTSCLSILSNNATDVHEFDAASHSGVDNIRALRDETAYPPASMKRRVYIIDEVHMLSTGAFNALLTILEEPPAHVLFILATTETHKVPATILSRCQKFHFKRMALTDIAARLIHVANGEGISLPQDGAHLLATWADGSMRDALSLLERAVDLPELSPEAIEQALGLAGSKDITALASQIASGDTQAALVHFAALYTSGKEASALLDELRQLLHRLLVVQVLKDTTTPLTPEQQSLLPSLQPQKLVAMLTLIQETQAGLSRSHNARLDAELCLVKLGSAPTQTAPMQYVPQPSAPSENPQPKVQQHELQVVAQPTESLPAQPVRQDASPQTALPYPRRNELLAALQGAVPQSVLAHIRLAQLEVNGNELVVVPQNPLAKNLLKAGMTADKIAEAASKISGETLTVSIGERQAATSSETDPLDALAGMDNVTFT